MGTPGLLDLDLPPGTGDTQLTLAQSYPLSGAIIVTTPQDVSLKIARRGLRMFETVHVPILGIIENMSTFTCPHCGKGTDVFRSGGGERMSRELGVPFLGAIPLDADIVMGGDKGRPIVLEKPNSVAAMAYLAIATELAGRLQGLPTTGLKPFAWTWETGKGEPRWVESAIRPSGSRTTAIGFRLRDTRTLSVLWEDGQRNDFDVRDLRLACRCAVCVEEMSGRPLLDPKSVRPDVTPRTITSVGNYAITISWNDGHSTGIYSFEHLRAFGERGAARVVEDVEVLPVDPTTTIRAETSQADPDTCKFTVSRTVHPGGPFFFDSKDRASGSPLVERLFALSGVSHVLVAETVVTVGKDPSVAWSALKSAIGAAIRTQLLTGVPAIFEAPRNAGARGRTDGEIRACVQELLDREVNCSIASHGGKISIVDIRHGNLFIAMSGGCQGCAASSVTLRQGFEVMVRRVAPEIVDIVDTTDHAAGEKPFYQRTV